MQNKITQKNFRNVNITPFAAHNISSSYISIETVKITQRLRIVLKDLYELFLCRIRRRTEDKIHREKTMPQKRQGCARQGLPSKMKNAVVPKRVRHRRAPVQRARGKCRKGAPSCAVCRIKTRKRLSERSAAQRETERAKRRERAAKAGNARQHRCHSVLTAPVGNKWHKKCNTLLKNRDERFVEEAARKQKRGACTPLFVEKISLFCRLFCCNARTE